MEQYIFHEDLEIENEKINQVSPIYMHATYRELKQRQSRETLPQGALIFHYPSFFPSPKGNASLCKRNFLRGVARHSKGHIAGCLGFAYS